MAAWINEFHYDNASTDTGEYVEIAAPAGTNLTGWSIVLYNGSNGLMYNTRGLGGIVPNQQNGFGTISFSYPTNGIENGSPDGIALVNNLGQVVEFISYEGSFVAVNGPAAGMTSTSIGAPSENGTQTGTSIGRVGTGDEAADFTWALINDDTPGGVNVGQSFNNIVIDKPGAFSIGDASVIEGNSGSTPITFTVTRGSDSNVAASVSYTVNLPGGATGASASDFVSPTLSGTLSFAANEFSKTITLNVAGDLVNEANETFTVTLSGPTNGATLADAVGDGLISNDDAVVNPGVPFINEIHYDNAGTDAGEAIEIAGPAGTNLAGWSLVLYSVSTGATTGTVYNTLALSGIVPDQDDGYGTVSFAYAVNGIQNGAQDGLALVDPNGNVVQFLSYEGSFVASNGPANGMTATDIGVSEGSSSPLGFSLQVVGAGASAADFTWVAARDDNFGAVNTDQDFIGPNATGQVRIHDASVAEGDSGTSMLVFTVTRAGGLGQAAGVDWVLGLTGSADLADLGAGQPLAGHVDFGVGVSSVTISVAIQGDTVGEGNETLSVLLANPTGNIAIVDSSATGTILNDDPLSLKIYQIQGEGHESVYVGQPVTTTGIVTGVVGNGFYLQDPAGDGNDRTSDAIFVFTDVAPMVAVGDSVSVTGTPEEFVPGTGSLSITELVATNANVTVVSSGNALPAAVLIGTGGRTPPTEAIEDDGLTSYDPATDGLDFYESMEGMRVTIDAPTVVSNTTGFGETWVLASGGAGATGYNGRTGIVVSEGDFNPERIQLDATSALFAGYAPNHSMGDQLADVTGIMSYGFNSYEVLVSEAVTVTSNVSAARETTSLEGGRDHLTVASFNVENLDPGDPQAKFDLIAQHMVYNLAAPDIIGVQEMQDGNGLNGSDPLSGIVTAQKLIDAIAAIGGPNYVYVEIAPSSAGSTGGEAGGNIRNGYFYNADRVGYVPGSAQLIEDPAFAGSRRPLVADFTFNGETVRLINVHFTSRLGSDPLMGANQPPTDAGDGARTQQAAAVAAYVNNALATNENLKLGVLGDFNGFYFEDAVGTLEATGLLDLHRLNAEEERYTYLFDGNLQAIDHMLVSGGLQSGAMFDAVHINAEQPAGAARSTDHDPIVGRFLIEHPNEAPFDLVLDDSSVDENLPAGTLVGTVGADDPDPEDVLSYTLVDDAGGRFALDSSTGALTTTAPLDHESAASYDIVIRATDPDGLSVERTVTIAVGDVNEAPMAVADSVAVDEDATTPNLWSLLLGNDSDPDAGTTLSIASVDGTGTLGSLVFDSSTQSLRYVADHDSFDALAPGQTVVDTFTYTVTDAGGLTSTATVSVTVTGIADGVSLNGGYGSDNLNGTGGEDMLSGGNGGDVLNGHDGHDVLLGGNGADTLNGGSGNDTLAGGNGNDVMSGGAGSDGFRFARGGGADTILDFDTDEDKLILDGIGIAGSSVGDVNGDGIADLTIAFSNGGGSVVLLGVSDFGAVDYNAAQAQAMAGGAMIY